MKIKAFPTYTSEEEERKSCPVISLERYLKLTKAFRGSRGNLFISYQMGWKDDVSSVTISRWMKLLIKKAYEQALETSDILSECKLSTHEVRALLA